MRDQSQALRGSSAKQGVRGTRVKTGSMKGGQEVVDRTFKARPSFLSHIKKSKASESCWLAGVTWVCSLDGSELAGGGKWAYVSD